MKALNLKTGNECAIKLVMNAFKSPYLARKIYREIKIMRKLSEMPNNVFVPELYDVILLGCSKIEPRP